MSVAKCFENGKLAEATAEELNAVTGGANGSLMYVNMSNGHLTVYGVVFNDGNIAWRTADGRSGSLPLK